MFQSIKFIVALVVSTAVFLGTVQVADARSRIADRNFERGGGSLSNTVTVNTRRGPASKNVNGDINRDAGTANSSARWTAADGRTATYDRSAQRTDNGYNVSRAYTDFQGRTATRSASADANEDSINRSYGATFRNGESANAASNIARTDDGFNRSKSFATSNGRGGSYDAIGARTDGSGTVNRAWTNRQGETVATKSVTYDDGTRTTVYAGRDGETKSFTSEGND